MIETVEEVMRAVHRAVLVTDIAYIKKRCMRHPRDGMTHARENQQTSGITL
ncbi:MAG TPA: hypothetical protein VI455_01155 [Terriglobia bacterium]